jgi:phage tail-like protein
MIMADNPSQASSSLLQYLPAIYQQDPFLGQFLLAFEKILLGRQDDIPFPDLDVNFPVQGLEETIAKLATYFNPRQTPDDFLPWLATWTAFTLRADLPIEKQRDFIARIIQLYRWRGTKQNLQELLKIFTIGVPTIIELQGERLQIGVNSTVGEDTILGGGPPHFFQVTIALNRVTETVLNRQLQIARALIDLEKPAHTFYELIPSFPTMQVGVHSTVGVDTLLGTVREEN